MLQIPTPLASRDGIDGAEFIIIVANDQKEFKMTRAAAKMSQLLTGFLEEADPLIVVPLGEVDSETAALVVAFVEHHKDNPLGALPRPLRGKVDSVLSEWDRELVNTHLVVGGDERQHQQLLALMNAANFMDIGELMDFTCANFASLLLDKNAKQIQELLGLPEEGVITDGEPIP